MFFTANTVCISTGLQNHDTRSASVDQSTHPHQIQTSQPGAWLSWNYAPRYLADNTRMLSDDPNRSLLQSSKSADVFVPATKTKTIDRAFRVTGPHAWSRLSCTCSGGQKPLCLNKTVKNVPATKLRAYSICTDSRQCLQSVLVVAGYWWCYRNCPN